MQSTFRILFYLKRDKQKADGTIPIWCRITIDGQAARFNTKTSINPDLWDAKAAKAIGKSKEVDAINSLLDAINASIHKVYYDLQILENNVNAELVKNRFLGLEVKNQTVLELFKRHNEDIEKQVGINRTKATLQKYEIAYKRVSNFIQEHYHLSDISLKDVNHDFLRNFEVYLVTSCKCGPNTTAKFLQRFRTIIILARNNGWLQKDPFANFKIRFQKVDRGYLTHEQIEILMNKNFSLKRLEQVRDIFVFCCYTGLAYIDVNKLRQSNIRKSFDGKLWIMGKREKTGINFNIPLLDIAKEILDKYAGTLPDDKALPVLSNQKMNSYLKEIGTLCEIDKELTFHLARHTFATLTLSKGVSIESVSKMLGHSNIKTTQIYAKITDAKVSNDMAAFAKKIETQRSGASTKTDLLFECLSLSEKMILFGLPRTLSHDEEREKRINQMWFTLSEEEKTIMWKNTFETDKDLVMKPKTTVNKLVINQ
ncbi:MAG: site-specific integrase [Tissierellia bacterium]|nr:site-specific integrase [Tissierellia bacterium]